MKQPTMARLTLLMICLSGATACGDDRGRFDASISRDATTPHDATTARDASSGTDATSALDADTSTLDFDDACGASTPRYVITDTTRDIAIDTREGYTDRQSSSCGGASPGADAFLALDAVAGEVWHLHLTSTSADRRPILTLASAAGCGAAGCLAVSNACDGPEDEHLSVAIESDGRVYVGVDDAAAGGGEYVLGAYRASCGDGVEVHGESCDDGNTTDGDGCDRRCRVELSELRASELEPNDGRIGANALRLPASSDLEITGSIGGPGACTYPDVFAVSVPGGASLHVDALNSDGTACAGGATTPFELSLENAAGDPITSGMRDARGCAIVSATALAAGEYFVRVAVPSATTTPASYRLRFSVSP